MIKDKMLKIIDEIKKRKKKIKKKVRKDFYAHRQMRTGRK
jgi:hypothetical protein